MKRIKTEGKKSLKLAGIGILLLCASFFLSSDACRSYNPSLYPSYDVLNPGPEVRKNPIGFTEDGNIIVNEAFILWVDELKQEVLKLRKGK